MLGMQSTFRHIFNVPNHIVKGKAAQINLDTAENNMNSIHVVHNKEKLTLFPALAFFAIGLDGVDFPDLPLAVGLIVGNKLGNIVGISVGMEVGKSVGTGSSVGFAVIVGPRDDGLPVGIEVGISVGISVGSTVGKNVG